jgi:sec-independent protein translocase protein TatA
MMPQGMEWVLIILAVVLLFGASKLPQLAKSLGQSKRAFKEGMREAEEDERVEQQKIAAAAPAPQVSQMSDEALMEEMRRRAEAKQV